jgi:hypothetical protein
MAKDATPGLTTARGRIGRSSRMPVAVGPLAAPCPLPSCQTSSGKWRPVARPALRTRSSGGPSGVVLGQCATSGGILLGLPHRRLCGWSPHLGAPATGPTGPPSAHPRRPHRPGRSGLNELGRGPGRTLGSMPAQCPATTTAPQLVKHPAGRSLAPGRRSCRPGTRTGRHRRGCSSDRPRRDTARPQARIDTTSPTLSPSASGAGGARTHDRGIMRRKNPVSFRVVW